MRRTRFDETDARFDSIDIILNCLLLKHSISLRTIRKSLKGLMTKTIYIIPSING